MKQIRLRRNASRQDTKSKIKTQSNREMMEKYLTLADAAKKARHSAAYLKVLIHRGKLKGKKIGRTWVTTPEWIEEYHSHSVIATPTQGRGKQSPKISLATYALGIVAREGLKIQSSASPFRLLKR